MNKQEFLRIFFGRDNQISFERIQNDIDHHTNETGLRPWVDRLFKNKETVLPLRFQGRIIWFGMAATDEQFNRLGEGLRHFIGRTYSTFIPVRAKPKNHAIDQAVNEYTSGRYYRFQGEDKFILDKLEYLGNMWEVRPSPDRQQTTSVGRLLREFYSTLTLGSGHRHKAEELLEEFRNRKLLNAVNVLFLQIKMLSEYQEWDGILSMRSLADVINMRRPSYVTEALLKAIYNNKLKSKENDIEDLMETFLNDVIPEYGSLITSRGNFKSAEAMILLMLNAVVIKHDAIVVKDLLRAPSDDETKNLLKMISSKLERQGKEHQRGQENGVGPAQTAILHGNFDYAIGVLKERHFSWDTAMMLFQCAYQLQTLEARQLALKAYQQLSEKEQEAFLAIRQNKEYLDEITEGHSSQPVMIPNNWLSWFESLENYTPMKNFHHAREGANEWSVDEMLVADYPIDRFIEQLYKCYDDEGKRESLYISFPHLLSFFQKDEDWPRREFIGIYFALLEMLSFNEEKGETELSIFQNLLEALLQVGVNKEKYSAIMETWEEIWSETASYKYLVNGISVFETLFEYPCPDSNLRLEKFLEFSNSTQPFVRKLNESERKLLKYLYRDFKQDDIWKVAEEKLQYGESTNDKSVNIWERVSGKTIGIYTLMESVSQRVRDVIKDNNNEINVIINNEKHGSESLKNMVKGSDILLVATASAKHAATNFIEQHIDEGTSYLRPDGKGSSSMLNTLEKHIEYLVSNPQI